MQQTIDIAKQFKFTAKIRGLVAWINRTDLEIMLLPVDEAPQINPQKWEKL